MIFTCPSRLPMVPVHTSLLSVHWTPQLVEVREHLSVALPVTEPATAASLQCQQRHCASLAGSPGCLQIPQHPATPMPLTMDGAISTNTSAPSYTHATDDGRRHIDRLGVHQSQLNASSNEGSPNSLSSATIAAAASAVSMVGEESSRWPPPTTTQSSSVKPPALIGHEPCTIQ